MLKISHLSKSYPTPSGPLRVLNNVSLEVGQGEFVSIMGRSGCGKTTLLNILGLIDSCDTGSYHLGGQDVGKLPAGALSGFRGREIGFIFQSFYLLNELNCRDNVALPMGYAGKPGKARRRRADELLETVGLAEKAKQPPAKLSGGQQQRVAIARALANSPKLVLADEPTGNLDSQNGLEIIQLLKKLSTGGVTVLMVTHDAEFAAFADRIIHMQDGQFV